MSLLRKLAQAWKGCAFGAALTITLGLLFLLLEDFRPGEFLQRLSYNIPFRYRVVQHPNELVLVYLDDSSHRDLNQPYDRPWDRGFYARLLERLTTDHARAVGFDIVFSGENPEHPEGDDAFASALKRNGKVVLGGEYTLAPGGGNTFIRPFDRFGTNAAAAGMVQVNLEQDFIVRKHLHVPAERGNEGCSSLSWQLAHIAGATITENPDERSRERWLNYYGPPGTIPNISFEQAIDTNACPLGAFENKIVLVGANIRTAFSGQRKDELRTPFTRGEEFVGAVDVQATQTLNLVRQDWLRRTSRSLEVVFLVLAGLLLGGGLVLVRPVTAVALGALVTVVIFGINQYSFTAHRLWFPWLLIVALQMPVAVLWSVLFNSLRLYVQNRLYEQSLKMYLSPKLVKKFAGDRSLLQPGARQQVLTVLFTDIADFTSLSESVDSDELARVMNGYFHQAVAECIHATDGTVVKYLGDGIFSFWNAPDEQADHAFRACQAALYLDERCHHSLQGKPLVTRIGLHTGIANVGNFGSIERVDYTALGESINLGSRIEGMNKFLGTRVLITAETHKALNGRLPTRFVGRFRLRGFAKSVDVHELLGGDARVGDMATTNGSFADALEMFHRQDFDRAETGFRRFLEQHPDDGPSQFYLNQISTLRAKGAPAEWGGETQFTEK